MAKGIIKRNKRQHRVEQSIFTNSTSDIISKIYKELNKLDIKPSSPIKKWEKSLMAEKHLNKCSTFLVSKEMQVNVIPKFLLTLVRMVKTSST